MVAIFLRKAKKNYFQLIFKLYPGFKSRLDDLAGDDHSYRNSSGQLIE